MSWFSLIGIEMKKLRRSHIFWLLLAPLLVLWIPMVINSGMNFNMQAEGISPEHNFLVQSLMGLAWFMFPASLVVETVLLNQTERGGRGMLKMLSLPVNPAKLCMAKFIVLLILSGLQMLLMGALYFPCAAVASGMQDYQFMLPPLLVWKEVGFLYLASIPMAACYWLLAVCVRTPVFAAGAGLALIVPSVLMINTKVWYLYPMCYPFYLAAGELNRYAAAMEYTPAALLPWIPVAAAVTTMSLFMACLFFGRAERRAL